MRGEAEGVCMYLFFVFAGIAKVLKTSLITKVIFYGMFLITQINNFIYQNFF
jgi:hypothetical protein